MKSLMGFDQANKLSDPNIDDGDTGGGGSSGGGGATGDIGAAVDYGSLAEGETVIDQLDSKFVKFFNSIKAGIQPTIDAFKTPLE